MRKATVFCLTVSTLVVLAGSGIGRGQLPQVFRSGLIACLHDEATSAADQARRAQALAFGRAVNEAQGVLAEQTRQYQPLSRMLNLPQIPNGFDLKFYTDGEGYVFSLKDARDPCHYGIFSDQSGELYEASPQVPQVAS